MRQRAHPFLKQIIFRLVLIAGLYTSAARDAIAEALPAGAFPGPPDVTARIGTAQIFDSAVKDHALLAGRDVIWAEQSGAAIPGTFSMFYMEGDRAPDRAVTLDWFEANHPDWVMRDCKGTMPREFGDPFVMLDIRNPEVRQYLYDQSVPKAVAQHMQAMAVDNISADDDFARCGIQTHSGWQLLYSGAQNDPTYAHDVADWLGWLAGRVHEAGMALAANHYYERGRRAAYLDIAAKADIVADEAGYTRHCKPLFHDSEWLDRITLFQGIAASKGLIIIDQVCPLASQITPELADWSLANYLLVKGSHSYLAITGENYGEYVDFPQLHLDIGRPLGAFAVTGGVYHREFARALVLLNPSATTPVSYDLGSESPWLDPRSQQHLRGTVQLAPGTALVLIRPGA